MTEAQRRLAAIVAADVVGYSRLMGEDEAGTLAALRALRHDLLDAKIHQYGGRIVKTMGDGLLLEFHSAVEAVHCALDVQEEMARRNAGLSAERRIELRIGVNVGDVVVEDGDIFGDGVNVAARLEQIAPPGGICVSDRVHQDVAGRLDIGFADGGVQRLKNIHDPVRIWHWRPGAAVWRSPLRITGLPRRAAAAVVIGLVLAIAGLGGWWWLARPPLPAAPPRLSIVVLPFQNLSDERGQDYFADGVTEDLTTDLSRIAGAFVISRNTAFTYKGKAVDPRQVGKELGVRYVLEGSIRRAGDQIRLNVQLIDAATGAHVWSERIDRPRAELGELQNAVTAGIANTLRIELLRAESRRSLAAAPANPDAEDLVMRGMALLQSGRFASERQAARQLFKDAVRLDDRSADAWAGVATSHVFLVRFSSDREADLEAAFKAAERAIQIDPNHIQARYAKALVFYERRQLLQAQSELEAIIALDPNHALAHGQLGAIQVLLGTAAGAFAFVERALALSPHDPVRASWLLYAGVAHLHLGEDARAVAYLQKAVAVNPNQPFIRLFLASAYGLIGDEANARREIAELKRLSPDFTLTRMQAIEPSDHPVFLAQRQRIYEGLLKAGLPK